LRRVCDHERVGSWNEAAHFDVLTERRMMAPSPDQYITSSGLCATKEVVLGNEREVRLQQVVAGPGRERARAPSHCPIERVQDVLLATVPRRLGLSQREGEHIRRARRLEIL
jgi:hypothetical protein